MVLWPLTGIVLKVFFFSLLMGRLLGVLVQPVMSLEIVCCPLGGVLLLPCHPAEHLDIFKLTEALLWCLMTLLLLCLASVVGLFVSTGLRRIRPPVRPNVAPAGRRSLWLLPPCRAELTSAGLPRRELLLCWNNICYLCCAFLFFCVCVVFLFFQISYETWGEYCGDWEIDSVQFASTLYRMKLVYSQVV